MRLFAFFCLTVLCIAGLTSAQYGYSSYGATSNTNYYYGIGALFFLLFFMLILNTKKSVPLYVGNTSTGVNVNVG